MDPSWVMCFFYDIRCQVSLSVPQLNLNEQQRAAVAHAASQQLTLVPEMHLKNHLDPSEKSMEKQGGTYPAWLTVCELENGP